MARSTLSHSKPRTLRCVRRQLIRAIDVLRLVVQSGFRELEREGRPRRRRRRKATLAWIGAAAMAAMILGDPSNRIDTAEELVYQNGDLCGES